MSATNGFTESTNSTACSTSQGATDCGRVVSVDTEIADRFLLCYFSQVNCSGEWSAWNSCNASSCWEGVELRYFQPNQTAAFGGEACPVSPESRPCTDSTECPVSPVCLACILHSSLVLSAQLQRRFERMELQCLGRCRATLLPAKSNSSLWRKRLSGLYRVAAMSN